MYLCLALLVVLSTFSESQGCGNKPFSARVVNGENASPHAWPWQISLRTNGRHICGGSLIDPQWVVTASHCVERNRNPNAYTVVVGAHTLRGSTSYQQTLRVSRVYIHERYSNLRNDITLLRLSSPVRTSSQVNTVCLPSHGSRAPAGSRCFITGWGRLMGGGSAANVLQQAMLPVADDGRCRQRNGQLLPVDSNSMICAGGQGKGGCQGDSGGPFVCQEGGRWVLRGAVSWGHKMCRTDYYTVFARVSSFVNWINSKKGGGGGSCIDRDRRCRGWGMYCRSNQYVKANCRRTCRLC